MSFDDLAVAGAKKRVAPEPPAPEDLSTIMYTSGTTGAERRGRRRGQALGWHEGSVRAARQRLLALRVRARAAAAAHHRARRPRAPQATPRA